MSTMITCTRRIQFCAGHRVYGHEGKCAHMHGHNYVALFYARATKQMTELSGHLDTVGRVIDFSVLKEKIGDWIDQNWDHGFIWYNQDEFLKDVFTVHSEVPKNFRMFWNPTAENMARFLLTQVCPSVLKHTGVEVYKVKLWETENCFAEASLE